MDPPLGGGSITGRVRTTRCAPVHHFTHIMNRVSEYFDEAPESEYGDFYVVAGENFWGSVTREEAERIEAELDRTPAPEWIVFHDRVGSRYRVRTRLVRSIVQSTAAQRAADRRLDRAREREEKEDKRPWDD
jgi:hypothetical protein